MTAKRMKNRATALFPESPPLELATSPKRVRNNQWPPSMPVSRVQPGFTEQACTADDKLPRVAVMDSYNSRFKAMRFAGLAGFSMAHGHPCWFRTLPACPCRPANRRGMSMRPMAGASSTRRSIIFSSCRNPYSRPQACAAATRLWRGNFSGYFDFDRPSV